jgi:hypothetical protein
MRSQVTCHKDDAHRHCIFVLDAIPLADLPVASTASRLSVPGLQALLGVTKTIAKEHKLFLRDSIKAYIIIKKQAVAVARKMTRATAHTMATLPIAATVSDEERPPPDTHTLFLSTDVSVTQDVNLHTLFQKGVRFQYLFYKDACDDPEWFSGRIIGRIPPEYWFLALFEKDNARMEVLLGPTSAACWAFQDTLNRAWYVSSMRSHAEDTRRGLCQLVLCILTWALTDIHGRSPQWAGSAL